MRIEVINKERDLITDFYLESNPFKIGETIVISVNNYDKKLWTTEEVKGDYKIDKIEHYFRKDFQINQKVCNNFVVSVEVTKIENHETRNN